jgi:hypothetical protein
MSDTDLNDLIRRLAYATEAALPHLRREADRERRDYDGSGLREITKQQRHQMAEKAVAEAFDLLGMER